MQQSAGVKGFTLMEIALVLGVIGMLFGAVWSAASGVYANKNAQQAASQMTQIANGYRTLYSQHNVDTANNTDITCTGVNAGLFPKEMLPQATINFCSSATANATIPTNTPPPQTPWRSTSYVQTYSYQGPPGVKIYYRNLSNAACNYLADIVTIAPNVIWESINGTSQWLAIVGTPPFPAPYTPAAISSYCVTGSKNIVAVMYKLK